MGDATRRLAGMLPAPVRARLGALVRPALPYPPTDYVACELCRADEVEVVGRRVSFGMRYTTVACRRCGLVYLDPRPSPADFDRFYRDLYPRLYGRTGTATAGSARGRAVFAHLAGLIDLDREAGIFDIGCGDGGLLLAFAEGLAGAAPGLVLAGCDPGWPEPRSVLSVAGRPIEVVARPVEAVGKALEGFTLLVMYDVVEHLLAPRAFLTALRGLARQDARLFLSTSCLDLWAEIPPGGWESYYLRLAHTFTFTRRTLESLLSLAGWQVVDWRPGPRGDQWVLAARAADLPASVGAPLPGHFAEVLEWIRSYRESCGEAAA